MEYAALFNILILLLFFLSRILTSEIYTFFYRMTKREGLSTHLLAFLFLPGVIVHELSHYLAAKFLFVPTGKVSLFPKKDGDYVKLGSVSIAQSNILKEFIIGVAPLISGILIILAVVYFLLQDLSGFNFLKIILSLYAIFVVSNTMYASRKDFQAALPFLVTIIVLIIVLVVLDIRLPVITFDLLPQIDLNRIFNMGSIYLGIPIAIDLIFILVLRIFNRMW